MKGFIYILSNPSMPGLVKIGKTTTSPSQRMSELHSTGVPTPFTLEFSVKVEDCHAGERAAHDALNKHRHSSNREFFRVPVKAAIRALLPVIGRYELVDFTGSHGVPEIEAEIERLRRAKVQQEQARAAERKRVDAERERGRLERVAHLRSSLSAEQSKLAQLGPRPIEKGLPGIAVPFMFCWLPVPLGWMVWIGSLQVFSSKSTSIGFVCIVLLIVGYIANSTDNKNRTKFEKAIQPFRTLDDTISRLEGALKAEGASLAPQSQEHQRH